MAIQNCCPDIYWAAFLVKQRPCDYHKLSCVVKEGIALSEAITSYTEEKPGEVD